MSKNPSSKRLPAKELYGNTFETGETLCYVRSLPSYLLTRKGRISDLDNGSVFLSFIDLEEFSGMVLRAVHHIVEYSVFFRSRFSLKAMYDITMHDIARYYFSVGFRPRCSELFFMVWYDGKYFSEVNRYAKDNLDITVIYSGPVTKYWSIR